MRSATTWLKALAIAGSILFLHFDRGPAWLLEFAVPALSGGALALFLIARLWPRFARLVPNPAYLFALPALALALAFRLNLEKPVPDPPADWYSLSGSAPVYDRALIARGTVREWTGPGAYLVDVQLEGRERKWKARRTRRGYNRGGNHGYSRGSNRGYHRTYGRDGRDVSRKRYGSYRERNSWRAYKQRDPKRPGSFSNPRRARGPERWVADTSGAPIDRSAFPVLIRVNDRSWFPGCQISLRVFGRGVPDTAARENPDAGYARYARRKGAASFMRISRRYHVGAVNCPAPDLRTRARQALDGMIDRVGLERVEAGIARGLLLGSSGYLDGRLKRSARELGILHVYAASGLHLALFFACLAFPLGFVFGRRHWLTLCAPLPLCFAYLWLLDFPVSLTRAFVFVVLYGLQALVPTRVDALDRLLNTALAALVISPRELVSLSGVLSFGAVAGILFFVPILYNDIFRPRRLLARWLAAQVAVSIAAGLGTTGSLLYVFGAFSYGSIVANLVVVPASSALLPLLYLLVACEAFGLPEIGLEALRTGVLYSLRGFTWLTNSLEPWGFYIDYGRFMSPPLVYSGALLLGLCAVWLVRGKTGRPGGLVVWLRGLVITMIVLLGPVGYALDIAMTTAWFFYDFMLAK